MSSPGVLQRVVAYLPWFIIAVGGTLCFERIYAFQEDLNVQQKQIRVLVNENSKLRDRKTGAFAQLLSSQCISESRIDDNLMLLSSELLNTPDHKTSISLSNFTSVVKSQKKKLNCTLSSTPSTLLAPYESIMNEPSH